LHPTKSNFDELVKVIKSTALCAASSIKTCSPPGISSGIATLHANHYTIGLMGNSSITISNYKLVSLSRTNNTKDML